jgi:hypothetical protein
MKEQQLIDPVKADQGARQAVIAYAGLCMCAVTFAIFAWVVGFLTTLGPEHPIVIGGAITAAIVTTITATGRIESRPGP